MKSADMWSEIDANFIKYTWATNLFLNEVWAYMHLSDIKLIYTECKLLQLISYLKWILPLSQDMWMTHRTSLNIYIYINLSEYIFFQRNLLFEIRCVYTCQWDNGYDSEWEHLFNMSNSLGISNVFSSFKELV